MANREIRFYLDEQMPTVIAMQLKQRSIDAVTVRDFGLRGDEDVKHLQRANEMGRVLCTMDDDFIRLAARGAEHAGIVLGIRKDRKTIGTWVRFLVWIHETYTSEQMRNHIEYLRTD